MPEVQEALEFLYIRIATQGKRPVYIFPARQGCQTNASLGMNEHNPTRPISDLVLPTSPRKFN